MGKKESLLVLTICSSFIFLSVISNLRQFILKPTNTTYTFLHNSVSDYPYYLSFIRQGTNGRLTTLDQFTSEPQAEGLIHIFYLMLGQGGKISHLEPIQIYFVSRLLLGMTFLIVCYVFIGLFFRNLWERLITFGIFLTAASFPKEVHFESGFSAWSYLYWWTEMDPLNRVTFIPHFLFGHISLVIILYLYLKRKNILILAFWSLITGLVHPPSLGMAYYILVGLLILKGVKCLIKKDVIRKNYYSEIYKFIIFFTVSVPSLVYVYYATTRVFPWTLMGLQESLFYAVPLKEYLLSIGPILPLALLGSAVYLSGRDKEISDRYSVLFLWVITDFIMIPLSELIHYSSFKNIFPTFANIRFLSMAIHLPLSVMTGYLMMRLFRKNKLYFLITALIYLILTVPMIYSSVNAQFVVNPQINQYVYAENNLVDSIIFLDKQMNNDETVLGNEYISQMIPIFSRSNVYFGQAVYTNNNGLKKQLIDRILNGKEDECTIYRLIINNRINYILVSGKVETDSYQKYRGLTLIKEYPQEENRYPAVFRIRLNQEYQDHCGKN